MTTLGDKAIEFITSKEQRTLEFYEYLKKENKEWAKQFSEEFCLSCAVDKNLIKVLKAIL